MTLLFVYLFLALFVSFLCSVLEAVLLSITPSYVASLEENSSQQKLLRYLKENIDQSISAILILNTVAHTMGAAGVGAEAVQLFGMQWQSLIAVVLTLLILYVSEIIPKTIGASYWRELAYPAGKMISLLVKLLFPFIWISQQLTSRIGKKSKHVTTRAEIFAMAEMGELSGALAEKEGQLIENIMQLKEVRVEDVYTPRTVVFSIDDEELLSDTLERDELFIYSRIPVYKEKHDNIVGMVFSRDVLKSTSKEDNEMAKVDSLIEPVFAVSENLPVYHLLDLFIKRKEHLFIVEDKFDQYMGIVTLEDAIETLLGVEIVDEVDKFTDMQQLARNRAQRQRS